MNGVKFIRNKLRGQKYRLMRPKPTVIDKVKIETVGAKVVAFFKDWGGVLTVIIAVVYTFPVGIWDRMSSNEEKLLVQSRQVIADGSSMIIERVTTIAKINDKDSIELLNRMYNVKFYNLVYTNQKLLTSTIRRLRSSEVATFAGLLVFSGNPADAMHYYDVAIKNAQDENIGYVNILRDKSLVLFVEGPTQDISRAREGFIEILTMAAGYTDVATQKAFATFLSELAYNESIVGDWACGMDLYQKSDKIFRKFRENDAAIASYQDLAFANYSKFSKVRREPSKGCPYSIPSIPG